MGNLLARFYIYFCVIKVTCLVNEIPEYSECRIQGRIVLSPLYSGCIAASVTLEIENKYGGRGKLREVMHIYDFMSALMS